MAFCMAGSTMGFLLLAHDSARLVRRRNMHMLNVLDCRDSAVKPESRVQHGLHSRSSEAALLASTTV